MGEQTREAARLRITHPKLTLAELGDKTVPPTSKDAIAGRLRRLHELARPHHRDTGNADPSGPASPPRGSRDGP